MKICKFALLLVLFQWVIYNVVSAQSYDSAYYNKSDYLKFKGDTVNFFIQDNITSAIKYYGKGSYAFVEDKYFMINAGVFSSEKSKINATSRKEELSVIRIVDFNDLPIARANIIIKDTTGYIIWGTVANSSGLARIANITDNSRVSITCNGYECFTFDFDYSNDYHISLKEWNISENKTLIFRINKQGSGFIDLTFLTMRNKETALGINELEKLNSSFTNKDFHNRLFIKE